MKHARVIQINLPEDEPSCTFDGFPALDLVTTAIRREETKDQAVFQSALFSQPKKARQVARRAMIDFRECVFRGVRPDRAAETL